VEISANRLLLDNQEIVYTFCRDISERRQIEGNMRRISSLVENSTDGIFMADRDGRLVYINDAALRLLGVLDRGAIEGRHADELASREQRSRAREAFKNTVRNGHWEGEFPLRNPVLGAEIVLQVRSFPIRSETTGKIEAIGAIVRDQGESIHAADAGRSSEDRFRQLAERAPDAIVVHYDGKVIYANGLAERMLRAVPERPLVGRQVFDVIHPADHALVRDRMRTMSSLDGNVPVLRERFVCDDGTIVTAQVTAGPVTYSGRVCVQAILRDIREETVE
jgi:PAS domain S-box-containing protein